MPPQSLDHPALRNTHDSLRAHLRRHRQADHYHNRAFLHLDGGWRVAPTFDVTPTLQVSPSRNLFLHLGAAGSGRSATLQAAIDGAASLGISVEQATAMAEDLAAMVRAHWRKVMADRGSSAQDLALMEGSFSARGAP